MANPQCENGYTKIANELLEALARIRIPGEARQVFDVILRKTFGYQKREDTISLSQFCLHTGLKRQNASRSIKQLESMRLISVIKSDDRKPQTFRINKDFSQWKPLSKTITEGAKDQQNQGKAGYEAVIKNDAVIKTDSKLSSLPMHTKERKKVYSPNSIEFRTSELLLSLIRQRNPNFKQPDLQIWAKHVDLMLRVDKRCIEETGKILRWSQGDSFWQNNILSTAKLREKYDQLYLKMVNGNGKHIPQRHTGVVL